MIPKVAIDAYLRRPLDDHLWVKTLSRKRLLTALDELSPRPQVNPALHSHQLACFLLGVSYPRFAFWLDMGTGKTLLSLELLRYWYECGRFKRALVFITSDKAFPTWEKQIARFDIKLPYCLLEGSSESKWRQLEEFGEGLVFISYPGAVALVCQRVGSGNKRRFLLDLDQVKRLGRDMGALILDESTRVGNSQSLTFRMIAKLRLHASVRYALAGRPFGRDPTMLWSQHYLIDDGATLGQTLGLFRAAFFSSRPSPWVSRDRAEYIREYKFNKKMESRLSRMIQHRSIAYSADECIDLPGCVPTIEEVAFSAEAESLYRRAIEQVKAAKKGDMRMVKNVFLRMRQLSSGFVGFIDDESGARAEIEFAENPKFDRLLDLLQQLPLDRKAVVFYDFTWSGRKITEAAKKLALNPIWIWSGTKDYKSDLARFETSSTCRLAVVQNRVGAMALDGLQVANYLFFYESPVSVIDREQAERRLRRQGQLRRVFQYDLVTRGSVDLKILAYHSEGEGLLKAILRDPSILWQG